MGKAVLWRVVCCICRGPRVAFVGRWTLNSLWGGWIVSLFPRHGTKQSISLRWWLVIAGVLVLVPMLVFGFVLLQGGRGAKGTFSLPEPSPIESAAAPAQAPAAEVGEEDATGPLPPSPWDTPERLGAAVEFLLARGDRQVAMRLLARMEPGGKAYEEALVGLNRRFVDAWHGAVATAVRECLAEDKTLSPATRQELVALLASCKAGRNRVVTLPENTGGARATLLAMHARGGFATVIDDCPEAYRRMLVTRFLGPFPGAVPLLGKEPVRLAWDDLKASLTTHLRARILLPALGERLGALREAARRSPAVETWLARVTADGKRWRLYLPSPDSAADRRGALALLPAVLRCSWQREAAALLLAQRGVRELLVSEKLLGAVWPGDVDARETAALASLVFAADAWRQALRALDYPSADEAAGDAVAVLLRDSRPDVIARLRKGLGMERTQLAVKSFPWYRVMRSLKVRDTPLFWRGHASLTAGQLAHLQGGDKQIEDISPQKVHACMLKHVARITDSKARRAAQDGARAYALNRGLAPRRGSNR